jgi:DNA (cytosine-5)-methyltransferase 1
MKLGSMFSGCGALDIAVELALGATTVWQVERDAHCQRVLARHWPDAQRYGDVEVVDPATLPAIDVLCGGFPCQDLSAAGSRGGLDASRSGLYRHLLRFAAALRPEVVVIENVPALLHYRRRLEHEWGTIGYGLTWRCCSAAAVGAPHLRRRVFVVARRGRPHGGVEVVPEVDATRGAARWPTTTVQDARSSGGRNDNPRCHPGTSLTDAVKLWPAPRLGVEAARGGTPPPRETGGMARPARRRTTAARDR